MRCTPWCSVATATLIVLVLHSVTLITAAPIPITACVSTAVGTIPMAIGYVPKYWTYKNIAPITKYVGSPDGSSRGITLSMAYNGTDCDVYFGPLTSQQTQSVNALVNCVWMASTVTSTEFNDRTNYPYFSRVMPAADVLQGGIAAVMIAMKWTTVSVLCTDNAYGQAAVSGLSQYLRSVNGELTAQCVSVSADYATVEKVVLQALASKTRVLYVASLSTEAAYIQGRLAILNNNVASKMIVVFCELTFFGNWATVPGAVTVYFGYNPSFNDFMDASATRDTTDDVAQYNKLGLKYTKTIDRIGVIALGVDSARLVYGAFDDYVGKYGSLPSSLPLRLQIVRNYTLLNAFTASSLTLPNGIRPKPTPMVVYNAGSNGTYTVVANITSDMNITWGPSLYLMGKTYALADVPPAIDPTPAPTSTPPYWIIGVVVGVLVLLSIPLVNHARQQMLLAVRPTDSTKPFAVMFVGVKNLGDVQDSGAENAAAALARVTAEVRKAVRKHQCYEARRVDESTVMIVAKELPDALRCAATIVNAVNNVAWASVMSHAANPASAVIRRRDGSSDGTRSVSTRHSRNTHTQSATIRVSSRGDDQSTTARTKKSAATYISAGQTGAPPALNIGVHFGFGVIDVDESLNTVSYVGGAVTRAAIVADAAGRDQVLVSKEVREAMEENAASIGAFEQVDGWSTVAPDTFAFMPKGTDDEVIAESLDRMRKQVVAVAKGLGGTEASGTIAAALQQADAGMAQKRIGVVVIRVPFLEDAVSDAASVARATDILEDIAEVASWHRGEVHSIQVDRVTILVNASVPAAQPVPKAALIALGVVDAVRGRGLACSAGVSGGPALVGHCVRGAGTSALGRPIANAAAAEEFAFGHGLAVCVQDSGNGVADLSSRLHVVTVGAVVQPSGAVARMVAAIAERDATGGEWLYAMAAGNAALAANEVAWNAVVEKQRPSAEVLAALHSHANQGMDEPTLTALAVSMAQLEQAAHQLE